MTTTRACAVAVLAVSLTACGSSSKKAATTTGGAARLSALDRTPVKTWQALLDATVKKCTGTPDSVAAAIVREWTASGRKVTLMTFATNVKAGGYGAAGTTTCDFVAQSIGKLVKDGTLTD